MMLMFRGLKLGSLFARLLRLLLLLVLLSLVSRLRVQFARLVTPLSTRLGGRGSLLLGHLRVVAISLRLIRLRHFRQSVS